MPRFIGTEKLTHFTASVTTKAVEEGQPATSHHCYKMTTLSVNITPLLSPCWLDIFSLQPDPRLCLGVQSPLCLSWIRFSNQICEACQAVCCHPRAHRAINVAVGILDAVEHKHLTENMA